MGKALLLSISVATLTAISVLTQITHATLSAGVIGEQSASKTVAREIALTGMSQSRRALLDAMTASSFDLDTTGIAGDYRGGWFSTKARRQDSLVTLSSTGQFNGKTHQYVEQYLWKPAASLPAYFEYAISCARNLNINQGITVTTADSMNASIVANGKLHIDDSSYIEGFGYTADQAGIPRRLSPGIFSPNVNPEHLDVVQQIGEIAIEPVDPAEYFRHADVTLTGHTSLGGAYALGTPDTPVIWHIDGNVTTHAPVSFSGYGALVVDGNVTIGHDLQGEIIEGYSAFGLYASRSITASANALNLAGHWFANQDIAISSESHVAGSLAIASQNCSVSNSITMVFYPPAFALGEALQSGRAGASAAGQLVRYAVLEW